MTPENYGDRMKEPNNSGLYIVLISVHGLIRGQDLELGRDADTGGQTKYVVDFAKALSQCPEVEKVHLVTRKITDESLDSEYGLEYEKISESAAIVRLPCGPDEYLPKESLWDYLDNFADNLYDYLNQNGMPDLIHSHYADAGYVATRLKHTTSIPVVHTGHSLGNDKRQRLMAAGMSSAELDERYNISRRIEAEEEVLAAADLVIASTNHEITQQYETYDYYQPEKMTVIPPGTDLNEFHPPELGEPAPRIAKSIRRFLDEPDKPIILALSRPDPRKNIAKLMQAYGESKDLQEIANLVIIAGNRDDIRQMDDGAQEVLSELLILIDYYDLYGKVALPKKHLAAEVPAIYRMAASSRGVFVNPALTEPFGLTLLESAASGLPFVATENGGPVDIVKNCGCGELIDPLDSNMISRTLKTLLLEDSKWRTFSSKGIANVAKKYSWQAHSKEYLKCVKSLVESFEPVSYSPAIVKRSRLIDRMIVTDLDKTLLSNTEGLKEFSEIIRLNRKTTAFGLATARRIDSVLAVIKKYNLPRPDIMISSLGTQIYYSQDLNISSDWENHVGHNWNPKAIKRLLSSIPGLSLQEDVNQSRFKISYHLNNSAKDVLSYEEIVSLLRQHDQSVNCFLTGGQHVDITPIRASKGLALRYVAQMWNIPLEHILVAGGGGTDEDLLAGNTLAVVVANRRHETLQHEYDKDHLYFAEKNNSFGMMEAMEHYNFFAEHPGVNK